MGEDSGGIGFRTTGEGGDSVETPQGLLEMLTGEPEVSGAPVEVETDTSVVTEALEHLDLLGDLDGTGDCSAELVADDVGLAGGLTVEVISLESISVIFLPAML